MDNLKFAIAKLERVLQNNKKDKPSWSLKKSAKEVVSAYNNCKQFFPNHGAVDEHNLSIIENLRKFKLLFKILGFK